MLYVLLAQTDNAIATNGGLATGTPIGIAIFLSWLAQIYFNHTKSKKELAELDSKTKVDVEKIHADANKTLLDHLAQQVGNLQKQLTQEREDCKRATEALHREFELKFENFKLANSTKVEIIGK